MRNDTIYFKVKNAVLSGEAQEVEFINDAVINFEHYNLLPSSVLPAFEVLKNAERSLDGTMSVDIISVKTTLTLTFDLLRDIDFQFITSIFDALNQHTLYPDGIKVEYFDIKDTGAKKVFDCYIDEINYLPFIVEDEIRWKSLTITLIEI